jgi:hypothetical protein
MDPIDRLAEIVVGKNIHFTLWPFAMKKILMETPWILLSALVPLYVHRHNMDQQRNEWMHAGLFFSGFSSAFILPGMVAQHCLWGDD